MIVTEGDHNAAGLWIGYAKARMKKLVDSLINKRGTVYERIALDGVEISLAIVSGTKIIKIKAEGKEDSLIIAWMGHWTNAYEKKYFDLNGAELTEAEVMARGWDITDDGKYYQVIPPQPPVFPHYKDPDGYQYLFSSSGSVPAGSSAGVAISGNNGRDAKLQQKKKVRVLLNGCGETLMTTGYDKSSVVPGWKFVFHNSSLIYANYNSAAGLLPRVDLARYAKDSAIPEGEPDRDVAITVFSGNSEIGPDGVLLANQGLGGYWADGVNIIYRVYKKNLTTGAKSYVDIATSGAFPFGAGQAICHHYPDGRDSQDIVRVNFYDDGTNFKSDPHYIERYSFSEAKQILDTLYRCANSVTSPCYYLSGGLVSGGPSFDPTTKFMTDSRLDTISNDAKIVNDMKHDGSLTYVRIQKDSQMTMINAGVYCAGELIEESGWQPTIKLHGDGVNPYDDGGPIIIWKTRYHIIHAHHGNSCDAVFYRKTVYESHSSDFTGYRWQNYRYTGGFRGAVRKTTVRTMTTYHLAVGGKIHDFPELFFHADEHQFTVESVNTAVGTEAHPVYTPWVDTVGSGNVNCCRAFSSESNGRLLYAFDIYPKTIVHDVAAESYGGNTYLRQKYDAALSGQPWPCSDDYAADNIGDRKTLLFGAGGDLIKTIPNFTYDNAGTPEMWERINGLSLVIARV